MPSSCGRYIRGLLRRGKDCKKEKLSQTSCDTQAKSFESKGLVRLFELKRVDSVVKTKADYLER
jgi:hypothetical protein